MARWAAFRTELLQDPTDQIARAEADLSRVLDQPGAALYRGVARHSRGEWRKLHAQDSSVDFHAAEVDYAPRGDRFDASALWHRGWVRGLLGKFAEAEADFQASLALSPDDPAPWIYRGEVRLWAGDLAAAEKHYDKAIALRRSLSTAWEKRGDLRALQGKSAAAIADFREAIALNPLLEPVLAKKIAIAKAQAGESAERR